MKYGYFDKEKREYVIDRVDVPVSWTNYLGVEDLCAVVNHTAGGYLFYKSPEYHRITRFRPNGVPMDRPGHYIYLRDDDTGEYWSVSWQPCGGELDKYRCRHGLSYSVYECCRGGVKAVQTLFIPRGEAVELWDLKITNPGSAPRHFSVYSYAEFSYHQIPIDNQNFQMSLYCAGSSYADGIIDYELFYEHAHQFMASSFEPDGYDCLRDCFLGPYRTEENPLAVERGACSSSAESGGNHCATLQKKLTLFPGKSERLLWMLGEGGRDAGRRIREKYSDFSAVDAAFCDLSAYWQEKLSRLQVRTPDDDLDTMLNVWNLYQSEVNVMFSRFASFIEVGGRTGLGYRDTAQDAMTIPHSNPEKCRERILQLMQGLTSKGYGLHLFDPAWFGPPKEKPAYKSPTVIPTPAAADIVHGLADACADDALWLVAAVAEYVRETGDLAFFDVTVGYADGGRGTVYEHLKKILDFSASQVGAHGICKGLRADWNDCLNLGGGESAMVSFLHVWALAHFTDAARALGREQDAVYYEEMRRQVIETCGQELWDGDWYLRGITAGGQKIGTHTDKEGRVHLESNVWAVLSGAADPQRGRKAMDAVEEYLYTDFGLRLNAPSYTEPNDSIGFVTRVYPGIKENGSIFSHPNPWAWCAEAVLGRGNRLMKFYRALCPAAQNDKIEIRQSEPYSYCQFIMGPDHTAFGRARHPFMTGSGGWSYFAATRYLLGIRPQFDGLLVDPCIPSQWDHFEVTRTWRGAVYQIAVDNPDHVEKGVVCVRCNGETVDGRIPPQPAGSINKIVVKMGLCL
ncbi:MAG: N,N'-diacetylchitobiose phosphorylase [Lachnospiraceae bacterium]|nr:N,N'-diacetylchitobiose phosphorylase [Lachnospiraceae bacterium]